MQQKLLYGKRMRWYEYHLDNNTYSSSVRMLKRQRRPLWRYILKQAHVGDAAGGAVVCRCDEYIAPEHYRHLLAVR